MSGQPQKKITEVSLITTETTTKSNNKARSNRTQNDTRIEGDDKRKKMLDTSIAS